MNEWQAVCRKEDELGGPNEPFEEKQFAQFQPTEKCPYALEHMMSTDENSA